MRKGIVYVECASLLCDAILHDLSNPSEQILSNDGNPLNKTSNRIYSSIDMRATMKNLMSGQNGAQSNRHTFTSRITGNTYIGR
jgi:hypothetical protein